MNKHTLLSCALAVLLSGCGALHKPVQLPPDKKAELAKHVISVDRDGKLKIIENGEVKDTVVCDSNSENDKECEEYLDGIIREIKDFKRGKQDAEVLFFVHGGLNTEREAMERAGQQLALIHEDDKYNNIYPIFVLWESDGLETYIDHVIRIRQGEASGTAPLSSPVYFLTDVGNSIVNAPKSWFVTGEHMWDSTKNISKKEAELTEELRKINCDVGDDGVENCDVEKVHYTSTGNYQRNLGRNLRWLLGSPSKAVVTPFAYTMGRPAWDIMLRRTNTLFYTPEDLGSQEEKNFLSWLWPRAHHRNVIGLVERDKQGSGALYSLLEKLKVLQQEDKKDQYIKITLVGHSMGAIVVNKIIMLEPKLQYKNIVHLASADSINGLYNTVIPYINYSIEKKKDECTMPKDNPECTELAKGQAVKFYSLMLHPDNEDREEAWGSLVPSGSLLTWIDNMYTSPETVFDRRSGRWDNIKKTIPYLPKEVTRNMHFKIFGIDSKQDKRKEECKNKEDCPCPVTVPQKHGDFDEMCFWDPATWK